MEGEASNCERPRQVKRQRRMSEAISYETSVEKLSRDARETLMILTQKRRRPLNSIHGTSSAFFDNTSSSYRWLRSGWLAEERRMPSGRIYRYFYDPKGQMYNSRQEVDNICEDLEKRRIQIILDD